MNDADAYKLVAGYGTDTLTAAEQERLFSAAGTDQAVFDSLVEEQSLRDLLNDPRSYRRVLIAARQIKDHSSRGVFNPILRPSFWGLGGAMAMGLILFLSQRVQSPNREVYSVPLEAGFAPVSMRQVAIPDSLDPLSTLLPQRAIPANLGLNKKVSRPQYGIGEPMRIGFSSERDAQALILETRADGSTVRLFPNRFMSSPRVKSGQQVLIPPAGQGDMEVEGPVGPRRLRLILVPANIDPLTLKIDDLSAISGKFTVIERDYVAEHSR